MSAQQSNSKDSLDQESSLLGYSYLALFGGLLIVAIGILLASEIASGIGAIVLIGALLANLWVKIQYYQTVDMTPTQRTRIVAVWAMLIMAVSLFIVTAVGMQFNYPTRRFFWPLIIVIVVLILLHRVFRGLYHPQQ